MKNICTIPIRVYIIIAIFTLTALLSAGMPLSASSLEYAKFSPGNDQVYAESAPIADFIGDLQRFYTSLKGPQAANEIMIIGATMRSKIGINLFDTAQLSAAGVNTGLPIGLSLEKMDFFIKKPVSPAGIPPAQKELPGQWSVFIPARDSGLLYRNMKLLFEKTAKPAGIGQSEVPGQADAVKEISSGTLFRVTDGDFFVARGARFVVVTGTRERALSSIIHNRGALSGTRTFNIFREHMKQHFKSKKPTLLSYGSGNTSGTDYIKSLFPSPNAEARENPIAKEIRENIVCEAGMWRLDENGLVINSDVLYPGGFFQDTEKLLPLLLNAGKKILSADYYAGTPAVYAAMNMNVRGLMNILDKFMPGEMAKFNAANGLFIAETGKDIRKNLIEHLTGNATLLLTRLPEFNDSLLPEKWEMTVHAGLESGKGSDIDGLLEAMSAAERKKGDGSVQYEKMTISGKKSWSITTTTKVKKRMEPGRQNQPEGAMEQPVELKKTTAYILLGDDEAVLSYNRDYLARMADRKFDKSSTPLAERLIGLSPAEHRSTTFAMYIKADALVDFVKTTPVMLFAAPFMPFFQNMDDITIDSRREGDSIRGTLKLRLKKGAGYH